jgi:lysozyme family protein
MPTRFTSALSFVLPHEGGYVNDPNDRGGATNKGITQRVYDSFRLAQKLDKRSVRLITQGEVEAIYAISYWSTTRCDDLPAPIDLVVFDTAVNMGPNRAGRLLQEALGTSVDGKIGPMTIQRAQNADARAIALKIVELRKAYYKVLAINQGQGKFLKGWLNRANDLAKQIK